jgi:tetratricopeptide (TPR) repeat protein
MARIVFVGNCQIQSICNAYKSFVSPWTGDDCTFLDAYTFTPETAANVLRGADILVGQVAEFKSNIDIDVVPAHLVKYRVPVVSGGFLWPFGGQPHPKTVATPYLPLGPYSAEFGDSYLNRMIKKGGDFDEILEKYMELDVNKLVNLDRLLELNLEKQRNRDSVTGFNIADVIEKHFRDEHLFLTPYHPNLRVARALIQQTFGAMGVEQAAIDRVDKWLTITPFPKHGAPIHPSVQRHFGLNYAGPDYRYRFHSEGTFTFAEYVGRYLRYEWNEPLEEGLWLAQQKQHEAAAEKIRIGLERSPQSSNGYHTLSGVLDVLGRSEEALAAARKAVDVEPDNPVALRHLGVLLGRTERLAEAAKFLRRAVDLLPGIAEFHVALSQVLFRLARVDEAIAAALDAIDRDPSWSNVYSHCAFLLESKGELREAEQLLRRAINLAPEHAHAERSLSQVLAKQNKFGEAVLAARRAVELDPNNGGYIAYLGHLLIRDARYSEGEEVIRQAIKLSPQYAGLYKDLSEALEHLDRRAEATAILREAIADGIDDAHLHGRLGHLLFLSDDLSAAEGAFRAAIEKAGDDTHFRASLAAVLQRQGRREEAEALS